MKRRKELILLMALLLFCTRSPGSKEQDMNASVANEMLESHSSRQASYDFKGIRQNSMHEDLREAIAHCKKVITSVELRKAEKERLMKDCEVFQPKRTISTAELQQRVASTLARAARKTQLLPLPSAKSTYVTSPKCEARAWDIKRLMAATENADNDAQRNQLKLVLAAAYVGAEQWDHAKLIYRELAREATQESVRQTALLNLEILSNVQPKGSVSDGRNTR
ncbi:MAG: hypothetical protein MUO70_01565 [Euryarchaeota archaeon]|nr:hypothetical protein [Euryarchaeota archaeon]